jgi:ankyrin repeat protein
MHAARSAEMVQLLLDYNADPDFPDHLHFAPIYWYTVRNDIAAMRVILQHDVEMTHFWRLLYQAAQRKLTAVELLVKHGADVEARDYDENTPLHLAAAKGKTDVVKFLVER